MSVVRVHEISECRHFSIDTEWIFLDTHSLSKPFNHNTHQGCITHKLIHFLTYICVTYRWLYRLLKWNHERRLWDHLFCSSHSPDNHVYSSLGGGDNLSYKANHEERGHCRSQHSTPSTVFTVHQVCASDSGEWYNHDADTGHVDVVPKVIYVSLNMSNLCITHRSVWVANGDREARRVLESQDY